MRIRHRAATLLIATALLGSVATTGTANASTAAKHASQYSGSFWAGFNPAMPTTVRHGSTVDLTLWFKQTSPDALLLTQSLQLQDGSRPTSTHLPSVSVQWRDPVTGRWCHENQEAGGLFEQPNWMTAVKTVPNTWNHLYMKITFGPSTPVGTWHLALDPAIGVIAFNKQGKYVDGGPEYFFPGSYTFKVI